LTEPALTKVNRARTGEKKVNNEGGGGITPSLKGRMKRFYLIGWRKIGKKKFLLQERRLSTRDNFLPEKKEAG